jgi:hypothetical protein
LRVRRTLWTLFCVVSCSASAAAASRVDPEWFPLRARSEWVYETHRDQTYEPEAARIDRTFHMGRSVLRAEAAPERPAGQVLVRETTRLQPIEGRGRRESFSAWTVYSFDGALRVHASSEIRADDTLGEVVYDPPLRLLAATEVGEAWDAGTFRHGGQSAKVRGEVVGIEDLEGKPSWTGCLKVRLAGNVAGAVAQTSQQGEIESGEYERLLWFARGVGIVRDVTTLKLVMRGPEGRRVRLFEVLSLRLLEHRLAQ